MKKQVLKFKDGDHVAHVNPSGTVATGRIIRADAKSHTPYDVQIDTTPDRAFTYHNVTADRLRLLTADTFFVRRTVRGNSDMTVFRTLNRAELFLVIGTMWYAPVTEAIAAAKEDFLFELYRDGETISVQFFKP